MHNQKGFIAISSVIVIMAVISVLSASVAVLSINDAQSALADTNGENTLNFVEGCTEDALLKARASSSYTGGNITRPEGTCTVSVVKSGTTWTLTVSTVNTAYTKTIEVVINRSTANLSLTTWKEI